jgi:hypothetical protein
LTSWAHRQADIALLAERQLFFVGGAPRSGTTWLQQLLDHHPDISCRGEGLFWKHLAVPLEQLIAERSAALEGKNTALFRHTGGYPAPGPEDAEFLLGSAILLAFRRQVAGGEYRAIGEKTPENVFLFPRLKRLFPRAKLIAIARDPRDVLTSAWHFFHRPTPAEDERAAKLAFIRGALPSISEGARAMVALSTEFRGDFIAVTYEGLHQAGEPILAELFRFLGVADSTAIVQDCFARTQFQTMTGGRKRGQAQNGTFLRAGTIGDWRGTLTPEMNTVILRELGWMFPYFGWQP